MSTTIKTIALSTAEEVNQAIEAGKIKLNDQGIALVINEIEEADKDDFEQVANIEGTLYAIEEAIEGESVDSETLAGTYVLNS